MITLKTTAHIDDNRQLQVKLPQSLQPGEYDLVIVIDEKPVVEQTKEKKKLVFANHQFPVPAGETFRREDMYGDDGR